MVISRQDHAAHEPHGHQVPLETGLGFINTLEHERGGEVEHLDSASEALHWFFAHQLMHAETLQLQLARLRADPAAAERTLARIRRVRAAMRELADAAVERRPAQHRQVEEINRALRTPYTIYLVPGPDGVSMDHRHEGDPIDGALARLAESIARELSQGHPERLRVCANEDCRWIFNDTSRSGRRRWCDMSTCGNRAKAARHRARCRVGGTEVGSGP
jgi:predicted RNA-binding Zn ribbon-like protein